MAKTPKPLPALPQDPDRPRQDFPTSMTAVSDVAECLDTPKQPSESDYRGKWRNQRDGFLYKHCVFPHHMGKTHKAIVPRQEKTNEDGTTTLIHTGLFWEGSPEDFHNAFRMESPE